MENEKLLEAARAKVRIWVTYTMTAVYAITALYLIYYLLDKGETQLAIGIFSGVASTTTGIIAFWFGNRQGQKKNPDASEDTQPPATNPSTNDSSA